MILLLKSYFPCFDLIIININYIFFLKFHVLIKSINTYNVFEFTGLRSVKRKENKLRKKEVTNVGAVMR